MKAIIAEVQENITFKEAYRHYIRLKKQFWSRSMCLKSDEYERRFFGVLNDIPLSQIRRKDIINALSPLINSQRQVSFKCAQSLLSGLFGWAVQNEFCEHNIIKDIEPKYFFPKHQISHHAHIQSLEQIIELKERICRYHGDINVKLYTLLQLYTATRPSEARLACFDEFDMSSGIWRIPAHRMKMRKAHEITLNSQISRILAQRKKQNSNALMFSHNEKPYHISTSRAMLIKLGYNAKIITPHGFRASFATIANELRCEHGFSNDVIQSCLAHSTQSSVSSAYNHADYKKQRAILMQWWGDKLGEIQLK